MSYSNVYPPNLVLAAKDLADAHRARDPNIVLVMWAPDSNLSEIRLIEVSPESPTTGEILPFRFTARPDLGVHYPSVVVLLSPSEWHDVQAQQLPLPAGWQLAAFQPI